MGYRLPFFPMYAAEMLADGRFQGWALDERGAWLTLLAYAWNDGTIPAGHTALARLLHVETGEMARLWSAIGDRFAPHPTEQGRLVCPRLEEERDHAEQLGKMRSVAGKKGANSRWSQENSKNGKRIRLPLRSQCEPDGEAMAKRCPGPSPSPSPPTEASASAPEKIRPLAVHLEGQCPALADALRRTHLDVDPGKRAVLWGEADAIVRASGVEAVLTCWAQAAERRGQGDRVPLSYLVHPMRDLAKRPAKRPEVEIPSPDPSWLESLGSRREEAEAKWAELAAWIRGPQCPAYPEKKAEYAEMKLAQFMEGFHAQTGSGV